MVSLAEKIVAAAESGNVNDTEKYTKILSNNIKPFDCNERQHSRCLQIVDSLAAKAVALQIEIDIVIEEIKANTVTKMTTEKTTTADISIILIFC